MYDSKSMVKKLNQKKILKQYKTNKNEETSGQIRLKFKTIQLFRFLKLSGFFSDNFAETEPERVSKYTLYI